MKTTIGFLKLSQKFRENSENEKYFPILDKLDKIASKHHDKLPYSFSLERTCNITYEDVFYVLSELYPEKNYSCKMVKNDIFCIRT